MPEQIRQPPLTELTAPRTFATPITGFDAILPHPDRRVGARGQVMEAYAEALTDDQVLSTFQQRTGALVSKETLVEPATDSALDRAAADDLREQLDRIQWDQISRQMLFGIHFGYSVAELMLKRDGARIVLDPAQGGVRVRDRARFRWGYHGELYLYDVHTSRPTQMRPERFWCFTAGADHGDQPYGRPLGTTLYWLVYLKRNGTRFWAQFLDKYGSPTALAKAPRGVLDDAVQRDAILDTLEAIHSDSAVAIPDDVAVELLEAFRKGTTEYGDFRAAMDAAISKAVLSQTMTTDNGSSRSQAQVHADVRDDVVKADADLLCGSFNAQVAYRLTSWNFPGAGTPRVWRDIEPPEDLDARAERDAKVAALGFEPTEDYVREHYGEGWVKKAAPPMRPPIPGTPGPGDEPNFAELLGLAADKTANRQDQAALTEAAHRFASQYQSILGQRIGELAEHLDQSGDLAEFRERLTDMLAAPPPAQAVRELERGGIVARLMGLLRGQRD